MSPPGGAVPGGLPGDGVVGLELLPGEDVIGDEIPSAASAPQDSGDWRKSPCDLPQDAAQGANSLAASES